MVAQAYDRQSAAPHSRAWPNTVALIAKPGGSNTGVGRYVEMLEAGLQAAGALPIRVAPAAALPGPAAAAMRRAGVDLRAFLMNYPLWAGYPPADVYHLTSQNLATLLVLRRPQGRVIVTVHDIIPYLLRTHPTLCTYRRPTDRLFDWLAMCGLRRADQLIADSNATKQSLITQLGIPPARISVVPLGIDQAHFRPQPATPELLRRYGLRPNIPYLIYVGSEDPRKNLVTLLQSLALVRKQHPDVQLIKVGQAHFTGERQRLHDLAATLGIGPAINWLDDVPEADLPALYSFATLCVMPSLYEGFGFPVLEAMACGTPVICARSTSLPEVAGNAGVLVEPTDSGEWAATIAHILTNPKLLTRHRAAGMAHVAGFTWEHTVAETIRLYQCM